MSNDRLYQVLLAPRVTEKTTQVGEDSNQYVFHVVNDASKSEVKAQSSCCSTLVWNRFAW